MRRVLLRQVALDELGDIIEFIADDKPGAAHRVLAAVEQCIAHITVFPESAPPLTNVLRHELYGIRRAVVTPHRTIVLFYFTEDNPIDIVSIRRAEQSNDWLK